MNTKLLPLVLSALACLSACTTPKQSESEYVSVRDGKFYLGEREYRYVGTNFWYGAILASEGRGGNRERLLQELDDMQAVGIDNVRVLVGGDGREGIASHIAPKLQLEPGVYNDTLLVGLDYLMAELEQRQMKAVLYFNNAWEWSGGYGAYLDWVGFEGDVMSSKEPGQTLHFDHTPVPSYDGWWEYMQYAGNFILNDSAKALAANHVRFIVSRTNSLTGRPYTESPAIMSWEIANEPRAFGSDALHKQKFVEWIGEQADLIRSLDPNHLITTGSEGRNGCEEDMELFNAIHTLPNIDYACIHIWPNNWGWLGKFDQNFDVDKSIPEGMPDPIADNVGIACEKTLAYIDEAYGYMQQAGRPVVLEEFGYPRDRFSFTPGSPTQGRDAYYKYVFDLIRDSGKIAGCNFWGWGGRAQVKHTIWQPYDDYVCDPAQEEQGLNSVFAADSSTLALIRSYALDPVASVSCTNDEDWVWLKGENTQPLQFEVSLSNMVGRSLPLDSLEVRITHDDGQPVEGLASIKRPANPTTSLQFTFDGLTAAPGFYHITIWANGRNITRNRSLVHGDQPLYIDHYVFGIDPEQIVSAPDAQPDFQQFWDQARAQLAATPMQPRVQQLRERVGEKKAYVAQLRGLDGDLVQIDYTLPAKPGKYPVHIINMGYSSKPWDLDLNDNGWVDVIVSSRGQGRNSDNNRFGDWVIYGLDDPQHYYYRGAYLDCSRAIDYLCTLPEVDTDNIFLEGGSQGGAYSLAAAALDHRVRAVACYVPFMSDFPDYFQVAEWPGNVIRNRQRELGMSDEQLYRNLSYFDIKNLAPWIECPVYMSAGLQDITCPPHTNFAGYNQVKSPKQYHVYHQYGHSVDYSHWTPTLMEWYNRWMKKTK